MHSKLKNDDCVIIHLFMDDMLIFGACIDIVSWTKFFLGSKFEMNDMDKANVVLGVRIIRKEDSILLSQEQYIEKLLKKFGYYDFKQMSTPYDVNFKLKKKIKGNLFFNLSMPRYLGSYCIYWAFLDQILFSR